MELYEIGGASNVQSFLTGDVSVAAQRVMSQSVLSTGEAVRSKAEHVKERAEFMNEVQKVLVTMIKGSGTEGDLRFGEFRVPEDISSQQINVLMKALGEDKFNEFFGVRHEDPHCRRLIGKRQRWNHEDFVPGEHNQIQFRAKNRTARKDLDFERRGTQDNLVTTINIIVDELNSDIHKGMADVEKLHAEYNSAQEDLSSILSNSQNSVRVMASNTR